MRKLSKREKNLVAIAVFMIVMVIAVGSTYAFWTTTQVQTDDNEINTTCLRVQLLNQKSIDEPIETTKGITLDKAFPISDDEGMKLEGYTFTIKNDCDTKVYYDVNLESLKIEGKDYTDVKDDNPEEKAKKEAASPYLQSEYIKTYISSNGTETSKNYKVLSNYTDVSKSSLDNETDKYEYKNLLHSQTIEANGSVTHNLKMWVDSKAPDTQMSKSYQGKIVIYSWLGESNPYPVN